MRVLSIVLVFTGITFIAQAQSIKTTTAKGVDLTIYDRFTVVKGDFMTPPDERKVDEKILFEQMKKALIREMVLKGYKYVEDSTAQLAVSYVAGAFNKTESEDLGPMGGVPASSGADLDQSRTWSRNSRQAFLIIDVENVRTKNELWTARSQVDLSMNDSLKSLDGIVHKSFKKFPMKVKKQKK